MTAAEERSEDSIRFSLALTIGIMISALLVALGGIVTYYTYENQKKTALLNTEKIFQFSSIQTEEKLFTMIHSVESFVAVSSALKSIGRNNVENLSLLLPYFNQSFQSLPWMTSFYAGLDDGSFYMIQALRDNEFLREVYSAPEEAVYAVKTISASEGDGQGRMEFRFYDGSLVLLQRRIEPYDGYDPRQRNWYMDGIAGSETVITAPYIFFSSKQIGITVAHALDGGEGVVGADTVLTTLAHLLQKQKLTSSTRIVMMEKDGTFILSADSGDLEQLQNRQKTEKAVSLHIDEMTSHAVRSVYNQLVARGVEGGRMLQVDGRKWFGHSRQLSGAGESGIYLTIVSPFEELMVNARANRRRNLLIILSVMTAAVAFGLYLSRRIAGSLHDLSAQAESVRDFQLSSPVAVHSRINEVDHLADSMGVMQAAINRFVEIARALSAEKEMERVLEMIVGEAQSVADADGGAIGLVSDDGRSFSYLLVRNRVTGVHLGGVGE